MDQIQFFQQSHLQVVVMLVQEKILLDQFQMVDLVDQVVVVLGIYQVQVLLQLVVQEIHLQ